MRTAIEWTAAHWYIVGPVVLTAVSSLATGLTDYPRTSSVLRALMAGLSLVTHADSPGTFKAPGVLPRPPA